ncbi:hypothetical protein BRARA_F00794 [Brassica rapa]|uniref:Uncharacterized protein n=2 Tax=Brassica campestris TaxID=3711 RepID=A0A397YVC0_BRACM|nr:hypothetical protein IGI04_021839 [Brassica rapa subsp. trilocularis]RID57421.1 hypothetical protein BRARA_F00794 [Brassica rapa]RID57422.1 hypothetical protein BRARA_F00794 [Brassica rapa]
MNTSGVQQNAFEETRRNSALLCPQPRRLDVLSHHQHLARSLRRQVSHQMELSESNSRREMLDLILAKGGGGCEQQDPFFTGSPPSRVSNPLTKDSLFRDELFVVAPPPYTPRATKPPPPPSPRSGGGGCVRVVTNFGNKPPVRVVGFNCLDRDRRSSVPTLA